MPDANYCALGTMGNDSSNILGIVNGANRFVSGVQLFPTTGGIDTSDNNVAIFR
jgi:hypothetical protein